MKFRFVGPPDIIELWAAWFAELGIGGRTYPSRDSDGQLRWNGEDHYNYTPAQSRCD